LTRKEACRVLGVLPDAGGQEIKRRYRQIMRQVHPDGGVPAENCRYPAHEVNLAYETLCREQFCKTSGEARDTGKGFADGKNDKAGNTWQTGGSSAKGLSWDAPVNPYAYRERGIFHYAEDYEGNILGSFCIAKGKYLWKTEEDFPLFLLSMYQCGKELLDEIDERMQRSELTALRQEIQPELTYLLSQQFIDGSGLLKELAREKGSDREGNLIFYVPAMLELAGTGAGLEKGEALFPSRLRRHRLYLKDRAGRELGYLSFPDDRLYYVVIPLFEQKRAKLRLRAAERQEQKGRKAAGRYQNLHLWLKVSYENRNGLPESLNLQIESLLQRYG